MKTDPGKCPRVAIAPDSFKGTLTSAEAARAIADGFSRVLPAGSVFDCVPMADGGEGTVDAWLAATPDAERVECDALDPLGRPIRAVYGWREADKTAVVELAAASGLPLLAPEERDPGTASTFGTGLLLRDAIARGAKRVYLGLGGSATNDGGTGLASALGARFLDADGKPLPPGGLALSRLARIDLAPLRDALRGVEVVAACDVTNPLCGKSGASAVYGPQKCAPGADTKVLVAALDDALAHFADIVTRTESAENAEREARAAKPRNPTDARPADRATARPPVLAKSRAGAGAAGAGAAGGAGFGVLAFLGGRLVPGAEWIAAATGLAERIARADWAVTGEGRLDAQTLQGKAPAAVAKLAAAADVPVAFLCGQVAADAGNFGGAPVEAASPDGRIPATAAEAAAALAAAAERLATRLAAATAAP